MYFEIKYFWERFDKSWKKYQTEKKKELKMGSKEGFNGGFDVTMGGEDPKGSSAALWVVIIVLFIMVVLFAIWVTAAVLWIICLTKEQHKNVGLDVVLGLFLIVFFPALSWIWLILYGTRLTCGNRK